MFGSVGRRAAESVIGLFALLGFAFVPLGSKTGLEHALAVLNTAPAREAIAGLMTAVEKAKNLVLEAVTSHRDARAPLPIPGAGAHGVRPLVPRLPEQRAVGERP